MEAGDLATKKHEKSRKKGPSRNGVGSWMGSSQYTRFWGRGLIGYRGKLLGFGVQGSGPVRLPASWSYRCDKVVRSRWSLVGLGFGVQGGKVAGRLELLLR